MLHGQETDVFADTGYKGGAKRLALEKDNEAYAVVDKVEKLKASVRAKVEH